LFQSGAMTGTVVHISEYFKSHKLLERTWCAALRLRMKYRDVYWYIMYMLDR
jgi:hypothetical protein